MDLLGRISSGVAAGQSLMDADSLAVVMAPNLVETSRNVVNIHDHTLKAQRSEGEGEGREGREGQDGRWRGGRRGEGGDGKERLRSFPLIDCRDCEVADRGCWGAGAGPSGGGSYCCQHQTAMWHHGDTESG